MTHSEIGLEDQPTIKMILLTDLQPHPRNQSVTPVPDKTSPEWIALVESIKSADIDCPLIVVAAPNDEGYLVVDGSRRLAVAEHLGIPSLPCIVKSESEVDRVIIDSMVARRNLTAGARAYFAIPFLPGFMKDRKERRIANLRNVKSEAKPLISSKPNDSASESNSDIANRLGVSKDTLEMARNVRAFLYDDICAELTVMLGNKADAMTARQIKNKQLEYREQYERELAFGEIALNRIKPAIAGAIHTEGKPKPDAKPIDQVRKNFEGFVFHLARLRGTEKVPDVFLNHLAKIEDAETLMRLRETTIELSDAVKKRLDQIKA